MGTAIIIIALVLGVAALMGILIVKKLVVICQPNEVLVFSGMQHKQGGREVGYRLIQGGRAMRIPLLERVDRLDLTNMVIDLGIKGAYSKGGIPLNVNAVANVKIASDEPTIGNAIERFLGVSRSAIMAVAKETLEGNLRGVLATLTPEEVNHDRVKFAKSLLQEADLDLRRLGLALDMLKVQHVSDDVSYLDSIGRRQSAQLLMRSRIAEADNQALAAVRNAENLETKEIARIDAGIAKAEAEAERRILDAQTRRAALIAEERSEVVAEVAKAEAGLHVQRARIKQVRLQLLADKIRPAEARRDEMIEGARADAAGTRAEGDATAQSIRQLANTWKAAGPEAREVFVAQKMQRLLKALLAPGGGMGVDRLTVIDSRLHNGAGGDIAIKTALTSEKLKHALGLDVPALLARVAG